MNTESRSGLLLSSLNHTERERMAYITQSPEAMMAWVRGLEIELDRTEFELECAQEEIEQLLLGHEPRDDRSPALI